MDPRLPQTSTGQGLPFRQIEYRFPLQLKWFHDVAVESLEDAGPNKPLSIQHVMETVIVCEVFPELHQSEILCSDSAGVHKILPHQRLIQE